MVKFYYHTWTTEEDATLTRIITDGKRNRKKTLELFEEAAGELQRTAKSCQNRWYELNSRRAATKAV